MSTPRVICRRLVIPVALLLGFSAGRIFFPIQVALAQNPNHPQVSTNDPEAAPPKDAASKTSVPVVNIWPSEPPAWSKPVGTERDKSDASSRSVAGKPVVRLGDVSTPQLHLYPVAGASTVVVICPGGGFSILAWDLEGTEIAEWLQRNGIAAAVLKYRVPTRDEPVKWVPPVQDLQRSISLIRSGAIKYMKAEKVGALGFSAGGHTATRGTLTKERLYQPVDKHDQASFRPDFAALVYTAYLTESKQSETLSKELLVDETTPPVFFAHAFDDPHSPIGSVALFAELKRKGIPSSLHVFSSGGHGFGGRDTGHEKDYWLPLFESWLQDRGF